MAYEEKQTFEGDWKCSKCGGAITKLPFEPDPTRVNELKCLDCFKSEKGGQGGGGSYNKEPRPMVEGNWTCSLCGGAITKLPFQPREGGANTLKCMDCFKK